MQMFHSLKNNLLILSYVTVWEYQTENLTMVEYYTQGLINFLIGCLLIFVVLLQDINMNLVPRIQVTPLQTDVKLMRRNIHTVFVTATRQTDMFISKS